MDSSPPAVTFTTTMESTSTMKRFPSPSTASPIGEEIGEAVAGPGTGTPGVPSPATIDNSPDAETFTTRCW